MLLLCAQPEIRKGAGASLPYMFMLLVIDIANTDTWLGVFDSVTLAAHWRLTTVRARTVDEWGVLARNLFALAELDFKVIDAIAVASVVPPLNFTLKRMSESYFSLTPLFIDHAIATGLPVLHHAASDVCDARN